MDGLVAMDVLKPHPPNKGTTMHPVVRVSWAAAGWQMIAVAVYVYARNVSSDLVSYRSSSGQNIVLLTSFDLVSSRSFSGRNIILIVPCDFASSRSLPGQNIVP